jgi:uncharacterized protein (UPF0332 family)
MAFDWTQYLGLAQELAQRSDEAALRTAISRAYYAVFCLSRDRLEQEGVVFLPDTNIHSLVWEEYRQSNDSIRYYIGIDGKGLRNARNIADYEAEFVDLSARTRRALQKAESILNALARL